MPQVDLETLVSACTGGGSNDRKVTCETQAAETTTTTTDDNSVENDDVQYTEPPAGTSSDVPPESFWLSKDAEFDWFDRNAFYERKESTKGITIGHSSSTHNANHHHPSSTSNSQRFSSLNVTSKPSIIGLPKTQKTSYFDVKRRICAKPANIRLLPKRPAVGKQASTLTEPSSPKVSCMGRVRSKRKSRRSSEPGKKRDKPVERSSDLGRKKGKPVEASSKPGEKREKSFERTRSGSSRGKQKTGIGSKLMAIFRGGKSHKKPAQRDFGRAKEESTAEEATRNKGMSASKRVREIPVSVEPAGDPPGLGGMKRFASGRKSTDDFKEVITGSLNLDRHVGPIGSN